MLIINYFHTNNIFKKVKSKEGVKTMKVNNVNLSSSIPHAASQDEHKIKRAREGSFSNTFGQFDKEQEREQLAKKLEDIEKKGGFLKDRMDLKDLVEYKKMISEFLEYTVKFSHKYSKETKVGRDGSYKIMGIIEKVNSELEALTQELVKTERDKIKIVESISGIQGLLLDVLM